MDKAKRHRRPAPADQENPATETQPEKKSESYAVGYRKPPVATRFKPGQSGNRKGRPKGAKSMATIVRDEFGQMITVQEGSRTRNVSKMVALVKSIVNRALQKGGKDAEAAIKLLERHILGEAHAPSPGDELSSNEADILTAFEARLREEILARLQAPLTQQADPAPLPSVSSSVAKPDPVS